MPWQLVGGVPPTRQAFSPDPPHAMPALILPVHIPPPRASVAIEHGSLVDGSQISRRVSNMRKNFWDRLPDRGRRANSPGGDGLWPPFPEGSSGASRSHRE